LGAAVALGITRSRMARRQLPVPVLAAPEPALNG
jgi:hypothetical protein